LENYGLTIGAIRCPLETYFKSEQDMSERARPSFFLIELKFDGNVPNLILRYPGMIHVSHRLFNPNELTLTDVENQGLYPEILCGP
jgi:hypothetical protein